MDRMGEIHSKEIMLRNQCVLFSSIVSNVMSMMTDDSEGAKSKTDFIFGTKDQNKLVCGTWIDSESNW